MLSGTIALKENDLQFISNAAGDVPAENPGGLGMYFQDTRFLNRFELTVNGQKPVSLSHSTDKQYIATFQSVNPPIFTVDGRRVRQQTVSIRRSRFVTGKGLFERLGFLNCNQFPVDIEVRLAVDADFRDIFAVRGFKTQRVAGRITVSFGEGRIDFAYHGRDGVERRTHVGFSREAEATASQEVRFELHLEPNRPDSIIIHVQPWMSDDEIEHEPDFEQQLDSLARSYKEWDDASTRFTTNNELFDGHLLRASRYDTRKLIEKTPQGIVPDAGIPWYAVPFGRDAIITSLQTLVYNPSIAEGTLRFLAAHQGTEVDAYREEEPGKILHELRRGELAGLKEVPHTPYFGTVDATPLFLVLLAETMDWLGSNELFDDLYPSAIAALEWIDRYGDQDGDGYVEYISHRPGGVANQGWKDSVDSVQFHDGSCAEAPIALVEVQGYVYQAKLGMAKLLKKQGRDLELAARLEREAAELRGRFNRDFWVEDEGYYALALDRDKRQVPSVTSNAGHCLWSGICEPDKARIVADRLVSRDMFSGWGIRTLSANSPNYNPMSYHNGSVWPHDTILIALGLRRSGFSEQAIEIATGITEAGFRFSDARLPELFCGFERDKRFNSSPAAYIVSCSPQAWAAGCVFMLLQTILGLEPDVEHGTVRADPLLPDIFRRVRLEHLRVGDRRLDVAVDGQGFTVHSRSSEENRAGAIAGQ
jgi:glycogen debranching enzyme